MKKKIALIVLLQLSLLFTNCSSDSEDKSTTVTPPVVEIVKTAKINSYSKDYGTTGETITVKGENFTDKVSDIKITFDGTPATILSATVSEISFTLPSTEKLVPTLVLTIVNRTVTNDVKNTYNGNIGILPIPSTTGWFTIPLDRKNDSKIPRIQMLSDKILYYTQSGSRLSRTLDGGITWTDWANNGFGAGFHATINDEGWSHTGFGISKIAVGGYLGIDEFGNFGGNSVATSYSMYVDSNMKDGTIITQRGVVFTTANGIDFNKIYEIEVQNSNEINIFNSTELDNDHIWAIGYKNIKDANGFSGNRPFILFKNNTADGWKEYPFVKENSGYYAREICFADSENGFLLVDKYLSTLLDVKLFKSTNGGDSWSQVYNGEKFTKFTFKDANTGWAILDNKIYKTIDAASTWVLDYTHDQPIRNISYKNNVVWAFSTDKIIKRYL
jgi:hypothetical protein